MNKDAEIQELINKVKTAEKGESLDLSSGEDLSIAVMNLISIEEHLFFSANKTGKDSYLTLLSQVREMRKSLLKKIIKNPQGEEWCISKHLLAASMRIMEVGTKSLTKGDKKEAKQYFQMAYSLYELFWGLNLNLLKTADLTKTAHQVAENNDSHTFMSKLGEVLKKAIDCCRE